MRLPIAAETNTPSSQTTTTERSVIPPLRILIVDDNRDSADMLATLLTDRRRSESAGFDAYLVKPVDDRVVGKLLLELRNGTAA